MSPTSEVGGRVRGKLLTYDDELTAAFLSAFSHTRVVRLVRIQLLLHQMQQLLVPLEVRAVSEQKNYEKGKTEFKRSKNGTAKNRIKENKEKYMRKKRFKKSRLEREKRKEKNSKKRKLP